MDQSLMALSEVLQSYYKKTALLKKKKKDQVTLNLIIIIIIECKYVFLCKKKGLGLKRFYVPKIKIAFIWSKSLNFK